MGENEGAVREGGVPVWFCWVPALGGTLANGNGGLHRAATRSKARYLCYLNVRDAGWDVTFADIEVRREPGWDDAQFSDGSMPRYARVSRGR